MKKIAISIGDINGVGLEIALKCHEEVSRLCSPVYCVDHEVLENGAKLLHRELVANHRALADVSW